MGKIKWKVEFLSSTIYGEANECQAINGLSDGWKWLQMTDD